MAKTSVELQTLLMAVDTSENTDYVFEWYIRYMHRPSNYLVCLHVPEGFDLEKAQTQIAKGGSMKAPMEKLYSQITELEEKFTHRLKAHKVDGRVLSVPSKNAGQTIVAMAKEENAFAVIMGSRGLSKLKKVIMGSCSDYVVQNSECPVIVVRMPKSNEDEDDEKHGSMKKK